MFTHYKVRFSIGKSVARTTCELCDNSRWTGPHLLRSHFSLVSKIGNGGLVIRVASPYGKCASSWNLSSLPGYVLRRHSLGERTETFPIGTSRASEVASNPVTTYFRGPSKKYAECTFLFDFVHIWNRDFAKSLRFEGTLQNRVPSFEGTFRTRFDRKRYAWFVFDVVRGGRSPACPVLFPNNIAYYPKPLPSRCVPCPVDTSVIS